MGSEASRPKVRKLGSLADGSAWRTAVGMAQVRRAMAKPYVGSIPIRLTSQKAYSGL